MSGEQEDEVFLMGPTRPGVFTEGFGASEGLDLIGGGVTFLEDFDDLAGAFSLSSSAGNASSAFLFLLVG